MVLRIMNERGYKNVAEKCRENIRFDISKNVRRKSSEFGQIENKSSISWNFLQY